MATNNKPVEKRFNADKDPLWNRANLDNPRTTPGITNKQVNPINRAINTVTSYVGNVGKEIKDVAKAYADTTMAQMDAKSYPPEKRAELNAKADAAGRKADKQLGQLGGAILQGRRYTN
jgi:hypothetical protein